MAHPNRSQIRIGDYVCISQRHAGLDEGVVAELLTNTNAHTYGILVKLTNGRKGRVQFIHQGFEPAQQQTSIPSQQEYHDHNYIIHNIQPALFQPSQVNVLFSLPLPMAASPPTRIVEEPSSMASVSVAPKTPKPIPRLLPPSAKASSAKHVTKISSSLSDIKQHRPKQKIWKTEFLKKVEDVDKKQKKRREDVAEILAAKAEKYEKLLAEDKTKYRKELEALELEEKATLDSIRERMIRHGF